MTLVALFGFGDGVIVAINDLVHVLGCNLDHLMHLIKVKRLVFDVHKLRKSNRGQVADSNLVRCCVLDNLSAQVRASDSSQVLLVRLGVARILVEHVWHAGLDLSVHNREPQLLGLDNAAVLAGRDVLVVQIYKLLAIDTVQARALAGAEQVPVTVFLHALHKQIGDPETQEQVTGTQLFVTSVLAQIQELENIGMPRLKVPKREKITR